MKYALLAMLSLPFTTVLLTGQTPVNSQPAQKSSVSLMTAQEKSVRAYIELLRSDLKKNKAQVMGLAMQLGAEDAAKFWPIYAEFEAEYSEFGTAVIALIKNYVDNYDDIAPNVADQLAAKLLDLEQERNNLKRKYYQKFKAALDPVTALRFLQVENQIERIVDLQIASELPVIEAPKGSQP